MAPNKTWCLAALKISLRVGFIQGEANSCDKCLGNENMNLNLMPPAPTFNYHF